MGVVPQPLLEAAAGAIATRDIDTFLDVMAHDIEPRVVEAYRRKGAVQGVHVRISPQKAVLAHEFLRILFALENILLLTHGMNVVDIMHQVATQKVHGPIRAGIGAIGGIRGVASMLTMGAMDKAFVRLVTSLLQRFTGKELDKHLDADMLMFLIRDVGKLLQTYPAVLLKNGALTARDQARLQPPMYVFLGLVLLAIDEHYIQALLGRFRAFVDVHLLGKPKDKAVAPKKVRIDASRSPSTRVAPRTATPRATQGKSRNTGAVVAHPVSTPHATATPK